MIIFQLKNSLGLCRNIALSKLELPKAPYLSYDNEDTTVAGFGYTWLNIYFTGDNMAAVEGDSNGKMKFANARVVPVKTCAFQHDSEPISTSHICARVEQRHPGKPEGVCFVSLFII